nr:hypothetical protein [uncultured Gellertiella sp.]
MASNTTHARTAAISLDTAEPTPAESPAADLADGLSLTEVIAGFRAGMAEFNAGSDDSHERAEATYSAWMHRLESWKSPAETLAEAVMALKLAAEENSVHLGSDVSIAMVAAALAFFEKEADR